MGEDDMEICKMDIQKIVKYLNDAAKIYDTLPGQRNVCRAWVIRQQTKKLEKKLLTLKLVQNDKERNR